jgi:hypothetical protein
MGKGSARRFVKGNPIKAAHQIIDLLQMHKHPGMLLSLTLVSSPSTSRLLTIPTEGQLFLGVGVD